MSFNVLSYVTLFNIVFVFVFTSLVQKSLGLVFYKGQSIHTFYCDDDMMTPKPWNKLWIFVLTLWVCILLWTVLFLKMFYNGTFQVPSFCLYVLHMLCTIMTLRPIKIYLFFHLSVPLLLSLYGSHKDNVEQNLHFIYFLLVYIFVSSLNV